MREVYKDFLTEPEIQSMLNNKDIWMSSEEVVTRLQALQKLREEQAEADAATE
jgi:hypothetical protein